MDAGGLQLGRAACDGRSAARRSRCAWPAMTLMRELMLEYRKAAEEAVRQGDFRRAAYIYGILLQDDRTAASALERAGLHHDAALIYTNKLNDRAAAAQAFEAAGEFDRALDLYKQRRAARAGRRPAAPDRRRRGRGRAVRRGRERACHRRGKSSWCRKDSAGEGAADGPGDRGIHERVAAPAGGKLDAVRARIGADCTRRGTRPPQSGGCSTKPMQCSRPQATRSTATSTTRSYA